MNKISPVGAMTNPGPRFTTFAAFWPYYLAQHADRKTRACHYAGLALAVALFGLAFLTGLGLGRRRGRGRLCPFLGGALARRGQ